MESGYFKHFSGNIYETKVITTYLQVLFTWINILISTEEHTLFSCMITNI